MTLYKELTKGLSTAQKRAFDKLLKHGDWQNAYDLGETVSTLRSLVKKGLVISKADVGELFFPTTNIFFKSKYRRERGE